MKEKRKATAKEVQEFTGLNASQISAAKKAGLDITDMSLMVKYRNNIPHADTPGRTPSEKTVLERIAVDFATLQKPNPNAVGLNMEGDEKLTAARLSLEQLEERLMAPDLSANEARTYKVQIDGLKGALLLRREMNQVISRAECAENMSKIALALAALLRKMESEIPTVCHGLPLPEAKATAKSKLREVQNMFAAGCNEFWLNHEEVKQ
jgi:hypothetical protein